MAETTLKTRIALLYKEYSEWVAIKDTFIPLKGEVCICNVPMGSSEVPQEPAVLIKVGNGTSTWAALPWGSSKACDVYNWAKKENLEWVDFNDALRESIKEYVGGEEKDTLYQIVSDGTDKWKLQKSEDKGVTWVDATGVIDMTGTVARLDAAIAAEATARADADTALQANITAEETRAKAEEAKKVDKEIAGPNGKAIIFNETDGGGSKFEHNDGTWSFAGVNDGGADGLAAQIYAVDSNDGYKGAKLDVTKSGIYYTTGETSGLPVAQRDISDNELVTKKDLAGGLHYIGKTTLASGETYDQAIARLLTEKGHTAAQGDIVIIEDGEAAREFIYDGAKWQEIGDEGYYATKAALQAEINRATAAEATLQTNIDNEALAREEADASLQANINAEATTRANADTTLQTNIDTEVARATAAEESLDARVKNLEKAKEPETKVINNINYLFANGCSIRIEDNATENIAYYCTAEGVQKSITFPYQSVVHGGGLGTADLSADFNSTLVIMNSGKVKNIYGGSRDYGNIGVATIVVNGGTLQEGAIGGGAAAAAGCINSVGLANITLNGGTSLMNYGGGMGLATVGKVNMLVNGGTQRWLTAGGANGTTGSANVEVTGGTIDCLQAVNRGTVQDATMTISGGTITNVYGGGETGDSTVTGKCEKTILHIEKSFNGTLNKGTYGGVEDASRVSGDYVTGTVTDAQAEACNLTVRLYPGLSDIAYSGNVNDLKQTSGDVLILNCNI